MGGDRSGLLAGLAASGLLVTVIALFGLVRTLTWAVITLGAEYAFLSLGRAQIGVETALAGSGLLVLTELVWWSREASSPAWERWMDRRRLVDLAFVFAGTVFAGVLVLAVASARTGGPLWLVVVGAAAASAAIGLIAFLLRRTSPRIDP